MPPLPLRTTLSYNEAARWIEAGWEARGVRDWIRREPTAWGSITRVHPFPGTDKRNLLVASYTVLSAIGRLNAQELAVAENVYDAEEHYHEVRRKWFDISITRHDGRRETMRAAPAK